MEKRTLQDRTDNELMALAAGEDREAFEELVSRYYTQAIRAAERMVRDGMLAQDIAQDCFADLYLQRRRYSPSFSFRTYLYALLRHKAIDYLRKAKRHVLLQGEVGQTWLENAEGGEPSPEEQFLRKEQGRNVAAQIERLPEIQRKALYLYAVESRSYREIAGLLDKSEGQIKIAIHRARKKLRSSLN